MIDSLQAKVFQMSQDIATANPVVYSFWLSLVALLFVYLLKYKLIKCDILGVNLVAAILELPIDALLMEIPIIILTSNDAHHQYTGVIMLFVSLIIMAISYIMRKRALICYNKNGVKSACFWLLTIFELIVSVFIAIVNYYLITKIWIGH